MKTETSTVLMNRSEFTAPLLAEAVRVAALGGSFNLQTKYTDSWYLVVSITYPEKDTP